MAERMLHRLPDADLELALRGLQPSLAWPVAGSAAGGPDLAAAVRAAIESIESAPAASATPATGTRAGWAGLMDRWRNRPSRPARRALVLALLALLGLTAIAGAMGLGLPGLRLIFGEAPGGPPPSVAPTGTPAGSPVALGASMGLGDVVDPFDPSALERRAGFPVAQPTDPAVGAPATAWVDDARGGQVTLLWPAGEGLPPTLEPSIGLLLSQFRGAVNDGFFNKAIHEGTIVEPVEVDGREAFWITGEPHVLFWDGPTGFVDDARRWVGDVLLWSDGPITFRLESTLGRDAAIRIAESLP
jgi:hypothetical protein